MRSGFLVFVTLVQLILIFSHWFLYRTVVAFDLISSPPGDFTLPLIFGLLSVGFIPATMLAFRSAGFPTRLLYGISAVWLGFFNFLFLAAVGLWIIYGGAALFQVAVNKSSLAIAMFGLAAIAAVYSLINAARIRVNQVTVRLPNLPESWRGRSAALISDVHLGHIRGLRLLQHITSTLTRIRPDIVFIAGDLFDGTAVDLAELIKPWKGVSAPFGIYFVAGNHEEFSNHTKYLDALSWTGVRVLNNEKIIVDGLQIVGVHYHDSSGPERFRSILKRASLDRNRASLLLKHSPELLEIAEEEGCSLQLSGHTHAGQLFPFTWMVSRIYGRFGYGLNRLGSLNVYTSCGAGTWGTPMRMGTRPEIALIRFAG